MEGAIGANCSNPPFTCLCSEQRYLRPKEGIGTNMNNENISYYLEKSKCKVLKEVSIFGNLKQTTRTETNLRTIMQVKRPYVVILLLCLFLVPCTSGYSLSPFSSPDLSSVGDIWKHSAVLDEDGSFVVDWTPDKDQITFQITVTTRGYIGFGLSSKPNMDGADIVVGWVHSGKAYLQDRHGKGHGEPQVDTQQDWTLIAGFENDTHTSLIMSRPYNTCDKKDLAITNDTIQFLWAYHPDDPVNPENPHPRLHYHGWRRGSLPVFLQQRARAAIPTKLLPFDYYRGQYRHPLMQTWFIRNPEVEINSVTDTVYWCKIFKRPKLKQKHHIVKYEPVFSEGNSKFLQHMILYECTSLGPELDAVFEEMSQEPGQECYQSKMAHLIYTCNHVVAAWARGSQGMTFPPEAGYPLMPDGPAFYMMETHYDNSEAQTYLDSSGIRVIYTSQLRLQDAGVLSLGMDPDWKHLIPPKQRTVVSEGHCVAECTQSVLPLSGIHVFGTILHTHLLGRKVRLRHLRKNREFEPIVEDNNYNVDYQEYRELQQPRHIRPGDHIVTECMYNSRERNTITLGGFKTRDEMCLSFLFYWPRVDLSFCHSKPSLSTVLQSLGIQELSEASNPITILHPEELRGKTLEWRLLNYNWKDNFDYFQWATSAGTFNPMCWRRGESLHPELENMDYPYPNITEVWKPDNLCKRRRLIRQRKTKNQRNLSLFGDLFSEEGDDVMIDDEVNDKPIERIDVDPHHHMGIVSPVYKEKLPPEHFYLDKNSAVISFGIEGRRGQQQMITADPQLEKELQEMESSLEEEVLSRQYPQQSPTQHNIGSRNTASMSSTWSKLTIALLLLWLQLCSIPND